MSVGPSCEVKHKHANLLSESAYVIVLCKLLHGNYVPWPQPECGKVTDDDLREITGPRNIT